jgi:site-specific DNA recombinase
MTSKPRIAIYTRLSVADDDKNELLTGTARQEKACRAFAKTKGWEVAGVYTDVDRSAYKTTVRREHFERLMEDVKTKSVDGVLVWKLDRLVRLPSEFHTRIWPTLKEAGVIFASVTEPFDTTTPMGMYALQGAVLTAELESATTSLRVKAAHKELLEQGRWNGGGRRPFGLTQDRSAIIPEEAGLVREAAKRIFAGDGLATVAKDWSKRGIKTTTGGEWRASTLRNLLRAAWISGRRESLNEARSAREIIGEGWWPAIVDVATSDRLRARLNDPGRNNRNGNSRSYLLSSLIYCGICDTKMIGKPHSVGIVRYACHKIPGHTACGRVGVVAAPVDELITAAVMERLSSPRLERALKSAQHGGREAKLHKRLREDEEALEQLALDHYVHRTLGKSAFLRTKKALEERIETGRKDLARLGAPDPIARFGGGAAVKAAWEQRDTEWRRALLRALIDRVTIQPCGRGKTRFDPARVDVTWRA